MGKSSLGASGAAPVRANRCHDDLEQRRQRARLWVPRVTLRLAVNQRALARLTGVSRRTSRSSPSSLAASIIPFSVRYF